MTSGSGEFLEPLFFLSFRVGTGAYDSNFVGLASVGSLSRGVTFFVLGSFHVTSLD